MARDMMALDGPRVPPARGGAARKLVILAHGYGSNGADLISLAPAWADLLPDTAFVSPNAPQPVPGYPSGYQWFPLTGLSPEGTAKGARSAAAALDGFIDAELARHRLKPADCALVGFSQGTMMSLHVGLRRPEPLAAVIGFSGLLAAPEALPAEIRSRPPVALVHGDRDDVIPVQALFAALAGLSTAGVPALWRISRGVAHGIAEDGLELTGAVLRDAFAGRFAGWAGPQARR